MKANKKRIIKLSSLLALCLVALLCFSACGASKTPKAADADGTIEGTDIKWRYISSSNTLNISGSGEIPSFENSASVPWAKTVPSIKKLEVSEGITKIGDFSFYGATAMKEADLPSTITSVGKLSFAHCGALTSIELPETLTEIGNAAFEGCTHLEAIKLGANLISLGNRAFAFCANLKSVTILAPVEIGAETFYNCRSIESFIRSAELTADMVAEDAFKGIDFKYEDMQVAVDANKTVTVTIKYVLSDGAEAPAPVVIEGLKIGEKYSQNSPELEGYTADKLTVTGNAPAEDTEIVVTYEKAVADVEEETETEAVDILEEPKAPNYLSIILMVVVIAGIGVGAYFLMKSDKKNAEKAKNQSKAKNAKK